MAIKPMIVAHGGVGGSSKDNDGCRRAVEKGYAILKKGGNALDAAIAAAVVLEDDGRFNAGSGAILRLDGKTVEMDAAVMDSKGKIGAIANLRNVKNPVLVARKVMDTPHILIAGEGANTFAKKHGFEQYRHKLRNKMKRFENIRSAIIKGKFIDVNLAWRKSSLKDNWNFDTPYEEVFNSKKPFCELSAVCDTIGAVAIDKKGNMAVANSTGGAGAMLRGRIGDSPMLGCGYYVGKSAAVATTGVGEDIIKKLLAKTVYDYIDSGMSVQRACKKGVSLYPKRIAIGVIAVSRKGWGIAHNKDMPLAVEPR